jgi:serine/threonine protein kinase
MQSRYYRAPECLGDHENSAISSRIDIWSLGCVISEMLHGIPLFPGKDSIHMRFLIDSYLSNKSNSAGDADCVLQKVLGDCLVKQPSDRRSADELLCDLLLAN